MQTSSDVADVPPHRRERDDAYGVCLRAAPLSAAFLLSGLAMRALLLQKASDGKLI
jgi:hypothetical protein